MLYTFQQGLLNMPPKRDPERRLLLLPIAGIRPNPNRARRSFRRASLSELMISIAQVGLIQPLTVRQTPDGYELIAGERRLKACRLLGLREVPCIVMNVGDERSAAMALIENVQREPLDPFEEAQSVQTFSGEYRLDDEQLSVRLGKSRSYVENRMRTPMHADRCEKRQTDRAGARRTELRRGRTEEDGRMQTARADDLCYAAPERPVRPDDAPMRIRRVPKDCRLFVNSVRSCIEQLDGTGIAATMEETRLEDGFDLVIHVRT